MNAKRSKALRKFVGQVKSLPAQTRYLIDTKTGVIRLGKCWRGLYQRLKRAWAGSLPATLQRVVKPVPVPEGVAA